MPDVPLICFAMPVFLNKPAAHAFERPTARGIRIGTPVSRRNAARPTPQSPVRRAAEVMPRLRLSRPDGRGQNELPPVARSAGNDNSGRAVFGTAHERFHNCRDDGRPLAVNDKHQITTDRRRFAATTGQTRRRLAFRGGALLFICALANIASPLSSSPLPEIFEAIRAADAAAARIGYHLSTANAPLCDRLEPGLGLLFHTPSQYARELRDEAIRHFQFGGPLGVEAVIPGSPAADAGIKADDTVTGLGPVEFGTADQQAKTSTAPLIEAVAQVSALPPDQPLELRGRRGDTPLAQVVVPIPACRTRFEVAIGPTFIAQADGEMVQISSRFFDNYPEDIVAAVIAHELAHNILRHRERLEARGVAYGILSGFGRNVRYFRQSELEADILSVSLLANAGYDPSAAARFWRAFGPEHAGGILRSRSHPAWRDRLATIDQAIAALGAERPNLPDILMSRERPLDGNWQGLAVSGARRGAEGSAANNRRPR